MSKSKEPNKKTKKYGRVIFNVLVLTVLSIFIGINVYMWHAYLVLKNPMPMPFGKGVSIVLSGSMEPELSVNDVIFVSEKKDYHVDDIVVYQSGFSLIVHRIKSIDGNVVITQGDANDTEDKPFNKSAIKGKVTGKMANVGPVVNFLKNPVITIVLFVVALLIIELPYKEKKAKDDDEVKQLQEEIDKLKKELK